MPVVSSATLRAIAGELARVPCAFNMCGGNSNELGGVKYPIYMKTCIKCWRVWELRRLADGATQEEMDALIVGYQENLNRR